MKKGILFVNLGSPESTTTSDVRTYLREFLSDKYVIDTPWLFRKFIVEFLILPFRPKKSSEAYKSIWWKEGSPLIILSERFTTKAKGLIDAPVALAMRYGNPSINNGITKLKKQGVTDILVVPLYPQYAMSTVTTVVEKAKEVQEKNHKDINLEFLPVWYNHPDYIEALSESIKENLPEDLDYLLFSYHGVPHSHIFKTDITKTYCQIDNECCKNSSTEIGKKAQSVCYRHQCHSTTGLIAKKLGLSEDKYGISFQSRLGSQPWLQPATNETLEALPAKGKRKIAVVCPAFISDCLETLEEISIEGKKEFLESGGKEFYYIDCLNDKESWVKVMAKWCNYWISN